MDEGNFLGLLIGALGALSLAVHRRREILEPWRLGHEHLAHKRYPEAEECFRRTLRIAERRFGPHHWRTAIHLNALGQALLCQGRMADATRSIGAATEIAMGWHPLPHPQLTIVFVGAAAWAREQGDLERARGLLERARRDARGDVDVVAAIERTLFSVETRADRPAHAAEALARVPAETVREGGVHPMVRVALDRLAAGDPARAVGILEVVVEAVAHPRFLQFPEAFYRSVLGQALARAGRHEDAGRQLERACHDYSVLLGPEHPAAAPVWIALAEALERLGDAEGAEEACRRVLALGTAAESPFAGPYRASAAPSDPLEHERSRAREILERVRRIA